MVTRPAVHFADEYKVECDGSFHARLHTRLLQCAAVLSAPPHDVRLSTKDRREYRSSDGSVLVVGV
jgi:hypothetical protein